MQGTKGEGAEQNTSAQLYQFLISLFINLTKLFVKVITDIITIF